MEILHVSNSQDNVKPSNLCVTGVSEGEEGEERETKGKKKNLKKIMPENFPNLMKIINLQI